MDLDKGPNEMGVDEQVSGKKYLDMPYGKVTILKESNLEKLRIEKEKSRNKELPQVVENNVSKLNENPVVSNPQVKILPLFPQRLKKKKYDSKL